MPRSAGHDSAVYVVVWENHSYEFDKPGKVTHSIMNKMKINYEFITHGDQDEFDPAHWAMNMTARLPTRAPETKLNILIIGAGFSGLVSALECWRCGHNVVGILDRNQGPLYTGTILYQGRNSKMELTIGYRGSNHSPTLGPAFPGALA